MTFTTSEIADQRVQSKKITDRFKQADSDWTDIRLKMNEDLRFYDGDQYSEQDARAARAWGNKVQIKMNFIKQFVQMVDNMRRQKDIAISCHATDEQGSKETAEVIEGLFRHIEDISHAKHAYNAAFGPTGSLVYGMGFIKVETDYVNKENLDQEIFIRPVNDPNKILPDFNAKCPVFSDAEYWFEFDDVTKEDYESQFPDTILASFPAWSGLGKKSDGWVGTKSVRLAKYWYKECEEIRLVQYEDGTIAQEDLPPPDVMKDDDVMNDELSAWESRRLAFNADRDSSLDMIDDPDDVLSDRRPAAVVKTRVVKNETVKWLVTNGLEILMKGEWHNADFPFVPAIGLELFLEGKRTISGITRSARDPQMMVNYLSSELIRKTAATTKSQWIADIDAIPPKMLKDWMSSNINEKSVLFWSSKMAGQQGVSPPQRADMAEPQLQGLLASISNFASGIKQTMGLTPQSADAMTGKEDNNQSGVALQTLTENGELANFHFSDNAVLTMKRLGEIVINLIPYIYDTERTIRIIGADGTPELVQINQVFQKGKESKVYDLTTGTYGIIVDTGPGYATKNSQDIAAMINFGAINPALFGALAPAIARKADWDADGSIAEVAEQWAATTFPWLKPSGDMDDVPPQVKAQMAQMAQSLQVANQHLQVITQEYMAEKQKNDTRQGDNATKIKVEQIKQETVKIAKQADMALELQVTRDNVEQTRLDAAVEAGKAHLNHAHRTRELVVGHLEHSQKLTSSEKKPKK